MKTILCFLSFVIASTLTATAAPSLTVKMNMLEHRVDGDKTVMRPVFLVESGRPAIIQSDKFKFKVTATLRGDGTVDLQAVVTEGKGDKLVKLAMLDTNAELGQSVETYGGRYGLQAEMSRVP